MCVPEMRVVLFYPSGGETCKPGRGGGAVGCMGRSDGALREVVNSGEGEVN